MTTRVSLWLIILGGMLVTYATRLSFIALVPYEQMPAWFRRGLRYVPPAVLAALVLPAFLMPDGIVSLSINNHRLLAGVVAMLAAWRVKNTWLTIASGMVALWLLSNI
jgi:branched-subunit amino acid transport protein